MATSPVTFPVSHEFGSEERIAVRHCFSFYLTNVHCNANPSPVQDHLALMRKFKRILEDVEHHPGWHADRFPSLPTGVSGPGIEGKWRVQCLLMNAEIRYSMYLGLLEKWITAHEPDAPKDEWPLPPWYDNLKLDSCPLS